MGDQSVIILVLLKGKLRNHWSNVYKMAMYINLCGRKEVRDFEKQLRLKKAIRYFILDIAHQVFSKCEMYKCLENHIILVVKYGCPITLLSCGLACLTFIFKNAPYP